MSHSLILQRTDSPILSMDHPWEQGSFLAAIAVHRDPEEDRLRLYYHVFKREIPLENVLCVAYSTDGYDWEKPDLGDGTNIVMRSSGNEMDWGVFMPKSVLYDEREKNPDWRWKMLLWERLNTDLQPGICWAGSPDGYSWTPIIDRQVITNANDAGTACLVNPNAEKSFRDTDLFVYQQTWIYNPKLPTDRDNLKRMHRVISIWNCDPFPSKWIGPTQILTPHPEDPEDLQLYWMGAYHTPTGYGAILGCHHTIDQTMDVQLLSSRDGWTWKRELNREPLIPIGSPGNFDCGMVTVMGAPIAWKDKVFLYYNGRATVHDGKLRYPDDPAPDPLNGIGVVEVDPAILTIGEPD